MVAVGRRITPTPPPQINLSLPALRSDLMADSGVSRKKQIEKPFEINVAGVGAPPSAPEIAVMFGKTNLTDGESTVNCGKVKPGAKAKRTLTIRNPGTATLVLSQITRNGKQAKEFKISKLKSKQLAPGASTTFTVTFKPTAKGIRKAGIHLMNNDSDEASFDVQIKGKGVKFLKKTASLAAMAMKDLMIARPGLLEPKATRGVTLADGKRYLTLTIQKSGPEDPVVEDSHNLLDWFSGPRHTTILQDDAAWLRVHDNVPVTPDRKRFIRVSP